MRKKIGAGEVSTPPRDDPIEEDDLSLQQELGEGKTSTLLSKADLKDGRNKRKKAKDVEAETKTQKKQQYLYRI